MRRRHLLSTVAAASVLAVVLAGCSSSGSSNNSSPPSSPPATSSSPSGPPSSSPPASSSSSNSGGGGRVAPKLSHFRIADVTYVGNQAWALGTAKCLSGSGTNCSAIEHSTNGHSWASLPTPVGITVVGPTGGSCTTHCIEHIRFATSKVGYLFGTPAGGESNAGQFYVTTDGGLHWRAAGDGTYALESLDGNVIRVVSTTNGCPPGCRYTVQTAPIGSTTWHTVALPGTPSQGDRAELARTGAWSYLLSSGNPAGGANNATSVLYASSDNGQSWTNHGEPCPQGGSSEVDSSDLTTAADGSVSVLCRSRQGQATFTATSTDHGGSFHAGSRSALGSASISAFAAASSRVLLVSSDDTYRSTDGGRHFARLSANAGSSPGQLVYLGFASSSVGHGVSTSARSIWTTTDGGQSWSSHTFS